MNRRKLSTFLAAVPLAALALLAGPVAAVADEHSESGATAVNVADQVVISSTAASTEDDGSADATVVEVGGETVIGSTQEGEGSQSGEAFTTGENEQGQLTIAPHESTVTEDESYARTAVADGQLGDEESDQYATVTVLESESRATDDGSSSSTTGARVDLGGQLMLQLLHAQTTSDGDGSSAVAYINDEGILTSEQVDGQCEIPADPLAHLLCLYADAYAGEDGLPEGAGDAGVLDATLADGNLTAGLFQVTADGGDGAAAGEDEGEGDEVLSDELAADDEDTAAAPSGTLPLTGGALSAALLGLGMLGAGAGLNRFRRS